MSQDTKCGFCGFYPKWLQKFATSRAFIAVFGLLGFVQPIVFTYMTVSLTTLEKRFKISSQTSGIILSGNEITEVLSVILIYYGGSGHRPRWIAVGVILGAVSCLIIALPHFIFGPGQDALALTHEYLNSTIQSIDISRKNEFPVCSETSQVNHCKPDSQIDTSVLPKILVFFSQIVLGVGTTLFYGLGQPYMDDNAKKKSMPMVFGLVFALRTIGPAVGFVFSYFFMSLYIDPTLHPIIDKDDPRWLGAWWLGWIVLGFMQALCSLLLAFFPQDLRKPKPINKSINLNEDEAVIERKLSEKNQQEKPSLKELIAAVKRISTNKLILLNTFSCVFYVLGVTPFWSFFAKYMEVQFNTSSADGTIVSGPLTLMGMVVGFLVSGFLISKFKPSPRPLMSWTVFAGFSFCVGQIAYLFISCDTGSIEGLDLTSMKMNLTMPCNKACHCDQVKFSPVCHEATKTTFFSACHAGCQRIMNDTVFSDCACVLNLHTTFENTNFQRHLLAIADQTSDSLENWVTAGPCKHDCFKPYLIYSIFVTIINVMISSAAIGSVLVNYRCVETRDKALAQGLGMIPVSLLALIPGPIIYGRILDSTCLVWDYSCGNKGNCWVYHKDNMRYYLNVANAGFCMVSVFLDSLVCYYSKDLDLYGEDNESEQKRLPNVKDNEKINGDEDTHHNL